LGIGERLAAIQRYKDCREAVHVLRGEPVEQEPVGLDHEPLYRRPVHDLPDKICPKERFAPVERERRVRVQFQELIERIKIVIQFDGQVFIDLDRRPIIAGIPVKCFCPAVRAAEVAVVREDEVVVQENPDFIRCQTR
jgi:hypothetical protein